MATHESEAPEDGRKRVIIEAVTPEVDAGRFPAKRTLGDEVIVEADAFTDGHDALSCLLLYRAPGEEEWREAPMEPLVNDRWRGRFTVGELGRWRYGVEAWVDRFRTWRRDMQKRVAAGQDVSIDLLAGAELVGAAAARAGRARGAATLRKAAARIRDEDVDAEARTAAALDPELARLMDAFPDRSRASRYPHDLELVVDPERGRFSAWYEFFPRSCGEEGVHGSFRDCEARLEYVARMGFDIVYLPPIHPIGRVHRKGKNNARTAAQGDVGSPWAIGSEEGGHKAIHPDLGTLEDFRRFREKAESLGMQIALDVAFQVAPDHPYAREHEEWFRKRPDGTIQYAENPPKKYEDIYPFDFETEAWRELWEELASVFEHWIGEGVKVFRVDNPHTKPFPFWEWAITRLKARHPEVLFLAEAFTRPKVMHRLAKLGFSQSYTYFAWRTERRELEAYMRELTTPPVSDFFRPNFWPNTPDILTEQLQHGGRPTFMARAVLASTLTASWGVYGPAFELMEHVPREPGSEEYLHSEKYQLRQWDLERPDSLADFLERLNRIRRQNPALQRNEDLRFHETGNPSLIAYSKRWPLPEPAHEGAAEGAPPPGQNQILVVVNLDPHHTQSGFLELPLERFGLDPEEGYQVHDLLSDARYGWRGPRNYVELNPGVVPAHILRIGRRKRSEKNFDYFV